MRWLALLLQVIIPGAIGLYVAFADFKARGTASIAS
jgi:hypothetical protein